MTTRLNRRILFAAAGLTIVLTAGCKRDNESLRDSTSSGTDVGQSAGNQISLTGCLQAGTDGAILTNVQGAETRAPGDTEQNNWYRLDPVSGDDLSTFAGNRVTVIGHMSNQTAAGTRLMPDSTVGSSADNPPAVPGVGVPSASENEPHGGPAGQPSAAGQSNLSARMDLFRVTSVRKLADTCE
jgi:hypothetical protein